MDDQALDDIARLLFMLKGERAWPRQRATIDEIANRYRADIIAMHERRMAERCYADNGQRRAA